MVNKWNNSQEHTAGSLFIDTRSTRILPFPRVHTELVDLAEASSWSTSHLHNTVRRGLVESRWVLGWQQDLMIEVPKIPSGLPTIRWTALVLCF